MTNRTFELGEITSFHSGGTPSRKRPEYFTGEIPWITGADIKESGEIEPRSFITREAVDNSAANIIPEGTVLLVTRTSVGKTAVTKEATSFSQDITGIRSDPEVLLPRYLDHFLRFQTAYFESHARGATIKGVNRPVVASLKIPVPTIQEQGRISDLLENITRLQRGRHKSIALLDELEKSIFLDMFRRQEPGWPSITVQDIVDPAKNSIRTGPFGSQLLHDEFVNEGIHVLGIDNAVKNEFRWGKPRFITEQKYQQLSRYTVNPGDLLITIMGTCGRCAVVPEDIPTAINTKHLCCITLDQQKCLPEFLHSYFLMHPTAQSYLRKTAKGAIMSGLNMGIIKKLTIALPPLELQQRYVDKVAAVREQKNQHQAHLSHLDELFASVQQRAFDGTLWDDQNITS